jgi:methylthioribose-1-phosphate isomerase
LSVVPFRWKAGTLEVLDQRRLPQSNHWIACRSSSDVARAIRTMAVRGAPAIGCVAAYGMVLGSKNLSRSARLLKSARPTAVNLAWAVDRMLAAAKNPASLLAEARSIEREDVAANRAIGRNGARLLPKDAVVLTHCNAGALATAGFGTSLGVIREAWVGGKLKKVLVDETRPYLQGARLTAWELAHDGIPHELITDNMAAHLMKTERISAVIVGCDRVAANGDTANKIGTYGLAILARHHGVPFYVAMPLSTLDRSIRTGDEIPIEERSTEEVVNVGGTRIAPRGTRARHPAFDVTPASLISAIICENGVARAPYAKSLKRLVA